MSLRSLCLSAALLSFTSALAQENLVYSNFYLNPYLYNPSFVASGGFAEVSANYRGQLSSFEGSPETATLNLQLPFNFRSAVGVSIVSDRVGAFQTTIGVASFRHQVFLGKRMDTDHKLGFGLSFGVINNKIDLTKVDNPTDPAFANGNNINFSGQFGVNYQFNRLRLAFSIPQLFISPLSSPGDFSNSKIEELGNTISSLSYNFALGPKLSFEPYALYRTTTNLPSQFEGLGLFRLNDMVWGGAAYRQDYGVSVLFGFSIKNNLKLGYAYEFGSSATKNILGNTHELQLSLKLGRQKARPAPSVVEVTPEPERPVVNTEPPKEEPQPVVEEPVVEQETTTETIEAQPADIQENEPEPEPQPQAEPEPEPQIQEGPVDEEPVNVTKSAEEAPHLQPGHYVVIGVFSSQANAQKLADRVQNGGDNATSAQYISPGLYFVYIERLDTLSQAVKVRNSYRRRSEFSFSEAWILSIQ